MFRGRGTACFAAVNSPSLLAMSRWLDETGGTRGASYDQAFRDLAASGVDVHGEVAYLAALLAPGATVLDAGCGTGRVGAELARLGHVVVGVDSDASMLDQAPTVPGATWVLGDLAGLQDVAAYDLVVAAGNVVVFLADGTGPTVLARLAGALRSGGLLVSGWRTDHAEDDGRPVLAVADYDAWCAAAGLVPAVRHRGWAGEPWSDDADWCVAVHQRP